MIRVERVTAAEAERRQRRCAGALLERGLEPGDRVVIVAPSSVGLLTLVLGALRRGIVPVLLNPALLPAEQDVLIADAEPAAVLREPEVDGLDGGAVELAPVPLARPMHYTSGTTGQPKGVWSGVLDERAAAALLAEERELWGFDADDVYLACAPMHHSAPLRFAAGTLLAGGDVVVVSRFDARTVGDAIAAEEPTSSFMAPAHLQRLFEHANEFPATGSFRLLAHAGAPCPATLKRRLIDAFPTDSVWEFYGSSEGQFTACASAEWVARPGTVGRARPGRALLTDDDGIVWCRAPEHARFEYWRDPAKTAAAWRDGAFTVGDLGRLDGDGYLFLDGRRDDLVISGGVNVYPAEVERVIESLPGVVSAAVFGVDDERWGQRVCAAVVGDVAVDAVVAFCRGRLAAYKCPKDVYVVAELPTSATGKVRRSTLAADLGL